MTDSPCQISPIKSLLYGEVIKVVNQLEKIDSFLQPDVLLTVHLMHRKGAFKLAAKCGAEATRLQRCVRATL
jgi:hypothetical protein